MSEPDSVKSTRPADVETSPSGIVKRWIAELDLADGEEKDWREESKKLWEQYEGKHRKADSFNILWSNTETLAPALYNTTPQPDVRRRFKDADPIGKHVSKIIERALSYQIDAYDFDDEINSSPVLSAIALFVVITTVVTIVRTGGRIGHAQKRAMGEDDTSGWLGVLLAFCATLNVAYYQAKLNKLWESQGGTRG